VQRDSNFWVAGKILKWDHSETIEQYFPVVLFIMLYKVVLTFESVGEILKWDHSETIEQYFPVVLFIMLYKVILTFESVAEILKCDHSNESYWAVLSCGAVYYAVKVVLTFESVNEILKCDHSNESYWAVLSGSAVYYAVQGGVYYAVQGRAIYSAVQRDSNFCGAGKILKCDHSKSIERYFPVVLFIMLYKGVLTFESRVKSLSVTNQMETAEQIAEQYFMWWCLLCKVWFYLLGLIVQS